MSFQIIKRGKNYRESPGNRPKRFQYKWADELWQKFIEAKNKKVDEVQAFAAYVASALADKVGNIIKKKHEYLVTVHQSVL